MLARLAACILIAAALAACSSSNSTPAQTEDLETFVRDQLAQTADDREAVDINSLSLDDVLALGDLDDLLR